MAESRGKHVTSTWRRGDVAKRERNPNRINRYITIGSDKAWVPLSLRSRALSVFAPPSKRQRVQEKARSEGQLTPCTLGG